MAQPLTSFTRVVLLQYSRSRAAFKKAFRAICRVPAVPQVPAGSRIRLAPALRCQGPHGAQPFPRDPRPSGDDDFSAAVQHRGDGGVGGFGEAGAEAAASLSGRRAPQLPKHRLHGHR